MTLVIEPTSVLLDEVVRFRVQGLRPGARVQVRARGRWWSPRSADLRWTFGRPFAAEAAFEADASGVVDPSRQAPVDGAYAGVDPMGLFWSMRPESDPAGEALPAPRATDLVLEVLSDGRVVEAAGFERWMAAPGVRVEPFEEEGLAGRLCLPAGAGPHACVLVLGGSEGGLAFAQSVAMVLASRGIAALALAYFGAEGLPESLKAVPLEYFETALDRLAAHPEVDGERLGVLGASKGAELALLLGATFDRIRAVAAYAPSALVFEGMDRREAGRGAPRSSWTYRGEDVPFARHAAVRYFLDALARTLTLRPVRLAGRYARAAADPAGTADAEIPVERIAGPVLLVSGADDEVWPSATFGERIAARRRAHGLQVEHLVYDGAGHGIVTVLPWVPTTTVAGRMSFGGTAEGNAKACADAWEKVLAFLGAHLAGPSGATKAPRDELPGVVDARHAR